VRVFGLEEFSNTKVFVENHIGEFEVGFEDFFYNLGD
jgi:hypothetical protein